MRVSITPYLAWQIPAYDQAFAFWASAIGADVFDWGPVGLESDVIIAAGPRDPARPNVVATTHRSSLVGTCKAIVLIRSTMDDDEAFMFGAHELGHVLGVGHSNDPDSVMLPELDKARRAPYIATALDVAAAKQALGLGPDEKDDGRQHGGYDDEAQK